MKNRITIGMAGCFLLTILFCCEEKIDPFCDGSRPAYASDIKPIIDRHCTSCHGSGSRNFKTYDGLKRYLDNGKFRRLVLEKQTMPKGKNLSQEELNKVQCWADSGFPEK